MSLSVVIPYRRGDPARETSLVAVKHWIREAVLRDPPEPTDWIWADDPHPDFNRGRAINAGVAQIDGDLLAFVDADLVIPGEAFRAGLEAVRNGAAMVVPFSVVVALNPDATRSVLSGTSAWGPWSDEDVEYRFQGRSTGGINILTRETFEAAGGFDPRFAGWGYEDSAFADAVETLVGRVEWLTGTAVHLWHPLDSTRHDPALATAGTELCKRYTAAWGNPETMKALIAER